MNQAKWGNMGTSIGDLRSPFQPSAARPQMGSNWDQAQQMGADLSSIWASIETGLKTGIANIAPTVGASVASNLAADTQVQASLKQTAIEKVAANFMAHKNYYIAGAVILAVAVYMIGRSKSKA